MSRARGLTGPASTGGARYSELIRGVLRAHVPPADLEVVVADTLAIVVTVAQERWDAGAAHAHQQDAQTARSAARLDRVLSDQLGSVHEVWAP